MIRIDEQDDVGLADLFSQRGAVLGPGGCVDDDGAGIFGGAEGGRQGYLRKNGLDLVCDKDVFDEGGNETGLAGPFVATDAYANFRAGGSVSTKAQIRGDAISRTHRRPFFSLR